MIGGSADLTGSNNTKTPDQPPVTAEDFSGGFIHWGIREFGMAAIMNGLALHGGFRPYGATFLTFSDYARNGLRMAALMKIPAIFVWTHDSIGLGEDGPTHQPVEQIPSLRSIPNLNVFRPGDATEVAECWSLAIKSQNPSVIALSRQGCEHFRNTYESSNKSELGGYEIESDSAKPKVCIIATGSEISIARDVKKELSNEGISCRVISMPSFELFDKQPEEYKKSLLETDGIRIGIEASIGLGWEKYLGDNGFFIGMKGFGASAPGPDLFDHFGINKENVLKNGIPVAIVGRPNSGKSTLLNSLLNEERAIVSNIAGTTRDTIEDEITIGGIRFRFIDTAGLRETTDEIEKIGVERALEKLEKSAIYIYLFDSTEMSVLEVKKELDSFTTTSKQLIVANKIDKASKEELFAINNSNLPFLTISAKSKDSLDVLSSSLLNIAGIEALDSNQLMLTNSRHYDVLIKSLEEISKVQEGIDNHLTGDLLAIDLRQALYFLGEITGKVSNDDLLGNIFANFCIGK